MPSSKIVEFPRQVKQGEDLVFFIEFIGIGSSVKPQVFASQFKQPDGKLVTLNCTNRVSGQRGSGVYEIYMPAWHFKENYGGLGNYSGTLKASDTVGVVDWGQHQVTFECVLEFVEPTGYLITQSDLDLFASKKVSAYFDGSLCAVGTELTSGKNFSFVAYDTHKITTASISGNSMTVNSDGSQASITYPEIDTPVFSIETVVKPKVVLTLGNSTFPSGFEVYKNGELADNTTQFYNGDLLSFKMVDERRTIKRSYLKGYPDVEIEHTDFYGSIELPWVERSFYSLEIIAVNTIKPYALETKDITELKEIKCSLFVNDVLAKVGTEMKAGDSLLLVADPSVDLYSAYYRYSNPSKTSDFRVELDKRKGLNTVPSDFTGVWGFSLTGRVIETSPPVDPDPEGKKTINNVYKVNKEIMDIVNKQRFKIDISGGESGATIIDYGNMMLSLIELPFKIQDSLIGDDASIQLGNYTLPQKAPTIIDDVIRVDLGSIKIDGEFSNSKDYIGTVALLHLPRIDPINIDLEYVIGQTIDIEYSFDVYTGKATVNIGSSKAGGVFITKIFDVGINIPILNINDRSASNSNIQLGGDNGVTKPFIELVKSDLILSDGFYTIPMLAEGILSGRTGYVEIDIIELVTTANSRERDLLVTQLKDGVIIK